MAPLVHLLPTLSASPGGDDVPRSDGALSVSRRRGAGAIRLYSRWRALARGHRDQPARRQQLARSVVQAPVPDPIGSNISDTTPDYDRPAGRSEFGIPERRNLIGYFWLSGMLPKALETLLEAAAAVDNVARADDRRATGQVI